LHSKSQQGNDDEEEKKKVVMGDEHQMNESEQLSLRRENALQSFVAAGPILPFSNHDHLLKLVVV
jgi:hypothetical protein